MSKLKQSITNLATGVKPSSGVMPAPGEERVFGRYTLNSTGLTLTGMKGHWRERVVEHDIHVAATKFTGFNRDLVGRVSAKYAIHRKADKVAEAEGVADRLDEVVNRARRGEDAIHTLPDDVIDPEAIHNWLMSR